jgi:DNA-binding response OmpR family regulator
MDQHIFIVSDVPEIIAQIKSAIDSVDLKITELLSGRLVVSTALENPPDLIIVDCQIGSMGGFAVCWDVKLEELSNRLPLIPVLILLDRIADSWLAKQAGADGILVKPFSVIKVRKAVDALLKGSTYYDESYYIPTVK